MFVVPAGSAYVYELTFSHDIVVVEDQYTPKMRFTQPTATHTDPIKRYPCTQLQSLAGKKLF